MPAAEETAPRAQRGDGDVPPVVPAKPPAAEAPRGGREGGPHQQPAETAPRAKRRAAEGTRHGSGCRDGAARQVGGMDADKGANMGEDNNSAVVNPDDRECSLCSEPDKLSGNHRCPGCDCLMCGVCAGEDNANLCHKCRKVNGKRPAGGSGAGTVGPREVKKRRT